MLLHQSRLRFDFPAVLDAGTSVREPRRGAAWAGGLQHPQGQHGQRLGRGRAVASH